MNNCICLLLLIVISSNFQFLGVEVSADSNVVRVTTTYHFFYNRATSKRGSTAFASKPLGPTDSVFIKFPSEYTLQATATCSIGYNLGTINSSPCVVTDQTITLTGIFPANTIVQSVNLTIINILNPRVAKETSNFQGNISDDNAEPFVKSRITITAQSFVSCSITFNPNIVNSQSTMTFTLTPTNPIQSVDTILISFATPKWTRAVVDVPFPISTSMSCTSASANVNTGIICGGQASTGVFFNSIRVSSLFTTAEGGQFSFSVLNFLSPPTNEPIDQISVSSQENSQTFDTCIVIPSGLVPKTIPSASIIINAAGTSMIVNQQYTLTFQFSIIDIMISSNVIRITYPVGSIMVLDTNTVSGFVIGVQASKTTYNDTTKQLFLFMDGSGTFPNNTDVVINAGVYTAPPSIKGVQFTIQVLQNDYPFMKGTKILSVNANKFILNLVLGSSTVNVVNDYTFTLQLLDELGSSGKIVIQFSSSIFFDTTPVNCAVVTGTNLQSTPTCTYNSLIKTITLSNINSTNNNIPVQNIKVKIIGIKNADSAIDTTTATIKTYYETFDNTLVSIGTTTAITYTAAIISTGDVTITSSSIVVLSKAVSYTIAVIIRNGIKLDGYLQVSIPIQIAMDTSIVNSNCWIAINSGTIGQTACSVSTKTTHNIVNISNPFPSSDISASSTITIQITNVFTNPVSTKPVSSFGIKTYSSDGFLISTIGAGLAITMTTPAKLITATYSKESVKNFQITTYSFTIQQQSQMQSQSLIEIDLPANIIVASTAVCTFNNISVSCTATTNKVTITTPANITPANSMNELIINNLRNNPSFKPDDAFLITTKTSNGLYQYTSSNTTNSISNSQTTSFGSLNYTFSSNTLDTDTTLTINFQPHQDVLLPTFLQISLPPSFIISTLNCNSFIDFNGTCVAVAASHTIQVTSSDFTGSSMSFTIGGFKSPIFIPTTLEFTTINSFDSLNFKMDQDSQTIKYQVACPLPCRTCLAAMSTSCLTCYRNLNVTSSIYYESVNKTCVSNCIDSQFEDTINFVCKDCNVNCLTCNTSSTFCTSCKSTSSFPYLNQTSTTQQCVSSCIIGMYPDTTQPIIKCIGCLSPCLSCSNSTFCLSCISTHFLWQNSCLTSCPSSITVANTGTNQCDLCSNSCLTCSGTINTCQSCNGTLILHQQQCLENCPSPLVLQTNNTCGGCDSQCSQCDIISSNCTKCDTSSTNKYLLNNQCRNSCPQFYFPDLTNGVCGSCSSLSINCIDCSSSSTCISCSDVYVLLNQSCLDTVPDGYVNISNIAKKCEGQCQNCINTTLTCISCKTLNYFQNTCVNQCPPGFIALNKICQPCSSPCKNCSIRTTDCTACSTTITPDVYLSGTQCLQLCPNTTYPNSTIHQCIACISPCQNCTSKSICLSCVNNFYLSSSSCLESCPAGFTGIDRICQKCTSPCSTCQNLTTLCLSCITNTYLFMLNCVSTCDDGLYIDATAQSCIGCTLPCRTCINSTNNCLSCTNSILQGSTCVNLCPDKKFNSTGVCVNCPQFCASCTSLTICSACIANSYLYNDFCIQTCPLTHSVIINQQCTLCTDLFCHQCSSNDVCTSCNTDYNLLNGVCLSTCPASYISNGTHCNDIAVTILSSNSNFPVPFTIAAVIFMIATLMSKLQFNDTYMQGAIFSILALLQVFALVFFLILLIQENSSTSLPFYISLGAIGFLFFLNILAIIIQSFYLSSDRAFTSWCQVTSNNIFYILSSIIGFFISHKFRNIMFCKLFTFKICSAQLDQVTKFRYFNVFAFLSLGHSGAAILAAGITVTKTYSQSQLYYECLDVIIVTSINVLMAFFNIMKGTDFFHEQTPYGYHLNKKILLDDEIIQSKIDPAGVDIENQQGQAYNGKINHALGSNQAFKFDYDKGSHANSSMSQLIDKQYDDVSVQALQLINDRTNMNVSSIPKNNLTTIQHASDFTKAFPKSDKSVQEDIKVFSNYNQSVQANIKFNPLVDQSMQYTTIRNNNQEKSIQNKLQVVMADQSIQKYSNKKPIYEDRSIQKTIYYGNQQSVQPSFEISEHKQIKQFSRKDYALQKDLSDNSIMSISKNDQSNQYSLSKNEIKNYSLQKDISMQPKSIQYQQQQQQVIPKQDDGVQYSQNNNIVSKKKYEQIQDNLQSDNNTSEEIIIQPIKDYMSKKQLKEQQKQEFLLPVEEIKNYQNQLEDRIRNKEKQLKQIKSKIELKQKKNYKHTSNDKIKFIIDVSKRIKSRGQIQSQINDISNNSNNSHNHYQDIINKKQNQKNIKEKNHILKAQSKHKNIIQEDGTIEQIQLVNDLSPNNSSEQVLEMEPNSEDIDNILYQEEEENNNIYQSNHQNKLIKSYEIPKQESSTTKNRSNSNKYQSKNNEINHAIIDESQIDHTYEDLDEGYKTMYDPSSQNITQNHIKNQSNQDRSDMSDTIEQIQFSKKDTIEINSQKKHSHQRQSKQKIQEKPYNKIYQLEKNKSNQLVQDKATNQKAPQNHSREKKSLLAFAGKQQFNDQELLRKQSHRNASPLKISKKWQFENQDRNIEEQGNDELIKNAGNQKKNSEKINKKKNQHSTQMILPFETDKEQTEFKNTGNKKFELGMHSKQNFQSQPNKQIEVHFDSQISNNIQKSQLSEYKMQNKSRFQQKNDIPNQPQFRKQSSDQYGRQEPLNKEYSNQKQYNIAAQRRNIILGQLLQRPQDDDLEQHYGRKNQDHKKSNNSRSRSKNHPSKKVYLQKFYKPYQ